MEGSVAVLHAGKTGEQSPSPWFLGMIQAIKKCSGKGINVAKPEEWPRIQMLRRQAEGPACRRQGKIALQSAKTLRRFRSITQQLTGNPETRSALARTKKSPQENPAGF